MTKVNKRNVDTEIGPLKQEKYKKQAEKEDNSVNCRCKEAQGKTFPQLLKQILDDLAFWKKLK